MGLGTIFRETPKKEGVLWYRNNVFPMEVMFQREPLSVLIAGMKLQSALLSLYPLALNQTAPALCVVGNV